jgi:hypothetical protein
MTITKKLLTSIAQLQTNALNSRKPSFLQTTQSPNSLRKALASALHVDNSPEDCKLNKKVNATKKVIVEQMVDLENKIKMFR